MSKSNITEFVQSPLIDTSSIRSYNPQETVVTDSNSPSISSSAVEDCAGKHFIVDFWGATHLDNVEKLEYGLKHAAQSAGAVLLHVHLHKFSVGGGVTGVALLAESHISVHTWPERDYAAFDVFMCGSAKPEQAVEILREIFKPTRVEVKKIYRGEEG